MRFAAFVSTLLLAACANAPTQQTVIDGATWQVMRNGSGSPAIVLQSGLGDGAAVWRAVFDGLAPTQAVIAIDRPGYGGSARTAAPRDPCSIADEQHTLLRRLGVPPPYLLVGHSLGGRYQWVYAALYPDEVAGLVLVEATHPEHWQRLQRDVPTTAAMVSTLKITFTDTMRREFDAQDQCLAERIGAAQRAAVRRIPTRVLARDSYSFSERGAFEQMHRQSQRDWLTLTGATQLDTVSGSGHYLQRDRPDAVLAAVRGLLPTAANARATRAVLTSDRSR